MSHAIEARYHLLAHSFDFLPLSVEKNFIELKEVNHELKYDAALIKRLKGVWGVVQDNLVLSTKKVGKLTFPTFALRRSELDQIILL